MGRGSPYMLAGPNGRTGMSASMQKEPLWQEERRYKRRGERPGGNAKNARQEDVSGGWSILTVGSGQSFYCVNPLLATFGV
jgi:hypothetical protein